MSDKKRSSLRNDLCVLGEIKIWKNSSTWLSMLVLAVMVVIKPFPLRAQDVAVPPSLIFHLNYNTLEYKNSYPQTSKSLLITPASTPIWANFLIRGKVGVFIPADPDFESCYGGGLTLAGGLEYLFSPKFSAALEMGYRKTSKNEQVNGAEIENSLRTFPLTLSGYLHLALPNSRLSPYIGLGTGINFAKRYTSSPKDGMISEWESRAFWEIRATLGLDYSFNPSWAGFLECTYFDAPFTDWGINSRGFVISAGAKFLLDRNHLPPPKAPTPPKETPPPCVCESLSFKDANPTVSFGESRWAGGNPPVPIITITVKVTPAAKLKCTESKKQGVCRGFVEVTGEGHGWSTKSFWDKPRVKPEEQIKLTAMCGQEKIVEVPTEYEMTLIADKKEKISGEIIIHYAMNCEGTIKTKTLNIKIAKGIVDPKSIKWE